MFSFDVKAIFQSCIDKNTHLEWKIYKIYQKYYDIKKGFLTDKKKLGKTRNSRKKLGKLGTAKKN